MSTNEPGLRLTWEQIKNRLSLYIPIPILRHASNGRTKVVTTRRSNKQGKKEQNFFK